MLYGGIDIVSAVKIIWKIDMVLLCCETFDGGWLKTVVSFGSLIADLPMSADLNFWRKQQPRGSHCIQG